MKLKNDAARIEFWIFTVIITISLIIGIIDARGMLPTNVSFHNNQDGFSLVTNAHAAPIMEVLFRHVIIFISYLLLCFYVEPAFESNNQPASNTTYVFIFIAVCLGIGITDIYFAALLAIKMLIIFFNRNQQNKASAFYYEAGLLTASWILIMVGVFYVNTPNWAKFYVIYDLPVAMAVYTYAVYRVIPRMLLKKRPRLSYFGAMLLYSALSTVGLFAICGALLNYYGQSIGSIDWEMLGVVTISNFFTQFLIVRPVAWHIYKSRNAKKDEEIKTLKTELGKSDANLNFLKSQINPHFLFNALNTLYGTALQENAERTGEGIQKLGDMMRFMLQENTQDTIRLSRDIDYLNNYILLQKLRTSTSEDVTIETQIEDYTGDLMITPMLLIPFVENAFKHGISLQNPSHIKITLQTSDGTLYFDVHNSIHIRADNDPEKGQSGIGLENVKQRLSLLYPDRHDLVIRQNAKEFFIHLTVQLGANN